MEDTQTIDWDVEEEEETEQSNESLGSSLEPVGRLRVFSGAYGPEKDFPLYLGKNVVGRMPGCSVALPFPSISKQHAVIEISARNKAAVLQDCGSLNGTQILRPPTVLSPGVSHQLRDHELILFADLPCQYRRLDVPLPAAFLGSLTVAETPRAPGGTHAPRLPLVQDSDEEADVLSERCVGKEPRTTSSPLTTIVPDSDDEGSSPAPGGPGPSLTFSLDKAAKASSAARNDATTEAEQLEGDRVTGDTRPVEAQPAVERDRDTEVRRDAGNGVVLERSHPPREDSDPDVDGDSWPAKRPSERAQPPSFMDSDTDVEEEGIPATPAAVLLKKRPIFHAAGAAGPGAARPAPLQESPAGSGTDVEEQKSLLAVPPEGSRTSMVISSDTDEEEVSAALTLARLKESRPIQWHRDTGMEEARAQPVVSLERNQTTSGGDGDTDVEDEELPVQRKEAVPGGYTEEDEALVTAHPGKSQPPCGDSDTGEAAGRSSCGTHMERSQASPTTVSIKTEAEEGDPPGPAVTHLGGHPGPVEDTNHTAKLPVVPLEEADMEEDAASAAADVRQSQRLAEGDAWERAPAVGAPHRAPVARVEQAVHRGAPGSPAPPQAEGAQTPTGRKRNSHLGRPRGSQDSLDADCEDLNLQATQCFLDSESLEAVQNLEDEPTQAFPCVLSPEPGLSHCSSQTAGTIDEPWEVLATQPFCVPESEASKPQPTATLLEALGSHLSPPRATPRDQRPGSPAHVEPLGMESRGMQTMERDRGTAQDTAERATWREGHRGAPPGEGTGHVDDKVPPAEHASGGDLESLAACLPAAAPEASVPPRSSFVSQSRKYPALQPLLSPLPSSEPPILRARHSGRQEAPEPPLSSELETSSLKRSVRHQPSTRMTPTLLSSAAHTPHFTTPTDQPATSEPASQASRDRTQKSSVETPEPVVHTAPELAPSTSTDQPDAPEPASRATRGRTSRSSLKTPEPVVHTAPELPPSTSTDQPDAPEPASRATRGRTSRSSVKTPKPVVHTAPELPPSTSTDQPDTPEPASRATRGRTSRSSLKTPEPVVHTAPELPPSTSTDQPDAPEPASRATRGRTSRSSVKTPEPVVHTAPELPPSTSTDQPDAPEPASRATRGRTSRSSLKTPEPVVHTAPELPPSTSTDQPDAPEPASRATRGRTSRSSLKTPEPVFHTAPELPPSTSTDQPDAPEPASRATRGRTSRSSVKTPKPVVHTSPELPPSTSTDQPDAPEPASRATRGRTSRSSLKTPEPVVHTAPELPPSTSTDQPDAPEPASRATRGRTSRSSLKTPEPVVHTAPELPPSTSTDQPDAPEPASRATRGRTNRFSLKTPEAAEPSAADLEPPTSTEQPVNPETTAQGSVTPESQPPVSTDPVPQTSHSGRQRASGKYSSLTPPTVHQPCSAPPGLWPPQSRPVRSQRAGKLRAAESLGTIPEAPPHAPQIPKVEPADRSTSTPEPQPASSQRRKRPPPSVETPPLLKRPQVGSQKIVFPKEEEDNAAERPGKAEDVVIPGPGKRKRNQTEEEPQEVLNRGLRRTKPTLQTAGPKVLFTGVVDARGQRTVLALGGSLASSAAEASHLVTDRIRRTVKFLCALGRGIPVLSLDWLHQSHKAGCFLPPDQYVVTDPEQEKNFGFSLRDTLSRAREQRLLEGYEIHVTPGVQPPPLQMGEIISCCGGTVLTSMPRSYKPRRMVITCPQDFPRCSAASRAGLPLLSPEFLLTGVLKQEVRPEAFVLSSQDLSFP